MNFLLDTHIFIWAFGYPDQLLSHVDAAIHNPTNQLYLSVASSWEMQIKYQLGKLTLPFDVQTFVETYTTLHSIQLLPITNQHIWQLNQLPLHHRDPFDRLIIAQANTHNLTLISADRIFSEYAVQLL